MTVEDLKAKHEKFLREAEDCALISKLAEDPRKRATFAKLALQLRAMAREVERDIQAIST